MLLQKFLPTSSWLSFASFSVFIFILFLFIATFQFANSPRSIEIENLNKSCNWVVSLFHSLALFLSLSLSISHCVCYNSIFCARKKWDKSAFIKIQLHQQNCNTGHTPHTDTHNHTTHTYIRGVWSVCRYHKTTSKSIGSELFHSAAISWQIDCKNLINFLPYYSNWSTMRIFNTENIPKIYCKYHILHCVYVCVCSLFLICKVDLQLHTFTHVFADSTTYYIGKIHI